MTDQNLVFRNEHEIKATSQYFNEYLPKFQKVVNEFADLQLGNIETRNDLLQAVKNPDSFINSRIEAKITNDNTVLFGGFKLKPAALAQMIDIKEKQEFITVCLEAKQVIHYFERIGTIKKGRIEVDKNLLEEWIKKNTIIAVTDREKTLFQAMTAIKEGITALGKLGVISYSSWELPLSQLIQKQTDTEFRINVDKYQVWSR